MTKLKTFLASTLIPGLALFASCNSGSRDEAKSKAVLDTISLSSKSFALAYQDGNKIVATSIDTMKQISFGGASNPAISPDANKLAYTVVDSAGNTSIWVADMENKSQLQLHTESKNFHSAVWSPNGDHIAFSIYNDKGLWKVGVIKTDNTGFLMLDSKSTLNVFSPSWKNQNEIIAHDLENLYTFDVTGKLIDTKPLNSFFGKEYNIASSNSFFYANNGKTLVFNAANGKPVEELHGMAQGVFVLDLDTKKVTRISPEGMNATYVFVTADDRIFYSAADKPYSQNKIYVSDLSGNVKLVVDKGTKPTGALK